MEWLIDIIKEWVIAKAYATEAWVLAKAYATEAWVLEWITPVSVTGDLAPDTTCTYFKNGTYGGKPYYRRQDGVWFMWWKFPATWILSAGLGLDAGPRWFRTDPDVMGQYGPLGGAAGTATVAEGRKYLCTGFVDRGDAANWDWIETDFIIDGNWHDLDLSGIIPSGTKAVLFRILVRSNVVHMFFKIRTKGNVFGYNAISVGTQAANVNTQFDVTAIPDSNGIAEYWLSGGYWKYARLCVGGWWF